MRVPATGGGWKPLCQAEMGCGAMADAIQGTGGMPERWGTAVQGDTFQVVHHYLEVTR